MAKIAYILLCHKGPDAIVQQVRQLTAAGDYVSIHFDARAKEADYSRIRTALANNAQVTFARRRLRCGWGEWSLVEASLRAIEAAIDAFPDASHFYMLSGDCVAIKSANYIHRFVDDNDADFIESFDFLDSDWIKTGLREERLIYRHYFNERTHKTLFYSALNLQRWCGLKRDIPRDLRIQIGSQWWCLRRQTVEKLLEFIAARRDIVRFFRTTWIPDETFFQTLVRHLIPEQEIRSRTLTFLMFSDYGMPVTFYNDHFDLLLGQDFLFARKVSPEARELRSRLGALYGSGRDDFAISDEGRNLYRFQTRLGRSGHRFAPRFWEAGNTLGPDRELLIILCKKWHVGKDLADRIRQETGLPHVGYLFNEEQGDLPDLGGLQSSLSKRARHRRALMRMLFDHYESDRLVICIDPSSLDLLHDFCSDRSRAQILEIECRFSDEYLSGHARRVGLAGDNTSAEALERLLPTLRNGLALEHERIVEAGFSDYLHLHALASRPEAARLLSQFLGQQISEDAEMTGVLEQAQN